MGFVAHRNKCEPSLLIKQSIGYPHEVVIVLITGILATVIHKGTLQDIRVCVTLGLYELSEEP